MSGPLFWVISSNAQYHGFRESARVRSGSFKPYVGTIDTTGDQPFFNSVDTTGLIFVRDPETHINFLVDTGSKLSILPCNRSDNDHSFSRWLYTADGTRTPAFEAVTLTVSLNLGKSHGISCKPE